MGYQKKKPTSQGRSGRKNLKYLDDGSIVNQYGVTFTDAEKRYLESKVVLANRKRKQMLQKEGQLPRRANGQTLQDRVATLHLMGKESDFILAKKSKSLQRFRSREQFDSYVKNLERVLEPDYVDKRTEQYRQNYITALERAFGSEADDLISHIKSLTPEAFRERIASDEDLEIHYIYPTDDVNARLNELRVGWGIPPKD